MIWAFLLGATPLDSVGAPLKLYLSDIDAIATVRSLEPMLSKCATREDATIGLQVELMAQGGMSLIKIDGPEDGATVCIKQAVQDAESPAHKGAAVRVDTTVYFRDGGVLLSPSPTIHGRVLGPLMLFVSGDQAARDAVTSHLNGPAEDKR